VRGWKLKTFNYNFIWPVCVPCGERLVSTMGYCPLCYKPLVDVSYLKKIHFLNDLRIL
jgi:hypothetical protein